MEYASTQQNFLLSFLLLFDFWDGPYAQLSLVMFLEP